MHGHQYVRITADSHNKLVGTVRDCEMDGLDSHGMHRWVQTEEGRANARLIAAAPELLEALARLMRTFPTDSDMTEAGWGAKEIDEACAAHDAARAAFAKATGGQA